MAAGKASVSIKHLTAVNQEAHLDVPLLKHEAISSQSEVLLRPQSLLTKIRIRYRGRGAVPA